ncbi:MAG: DUF3027 domain-containing protein [Varibaculum sp.]|nr:DUF3027 domain-containing protein [Varibaculum sp.]
MPERPESRSTSRNADRVLADAVDQAREALAPIAHPDEIGEYLGVSADGQRLATHAFDCLKEGYRGWRWVVTLTRVPRSRSATICEIDLLPGEDSLLAPPWVPWDERLEPGDVGRDDVLPYRADDERLDQSFEDVSEDDMDRRTVEELGLGRARVLNRAGRSEAAERWYNSAAGPVRRRGGKRGKIPAETCSTCGFMLKMAGSFRARFGVCSNEWSPDDGHVVSLDHSCGAHSETDIEHRPRQWQPEAPRLDENDLEQVEL